MANTRKRAAVCVRRGGAGATLVHRGLAKTTITKDHGPCILCLSSSREAISDDSTACYATTAHSGVFSSKANQGTEHISRCAVNLHDLPRFPQYGESACPPLHPWAPEETLPYVEAGGIFCRGASLKKLHNSRSDPAKSGPSEFLASFGST
ncbi:hypothetical protein LX36DRAFT_703812 [Colletotrichum falcatum]|nr:hypothetical protein LX36DRAFT_703812 [Colletotrichum falcatum]